MSDEGRVHIIADSARNSRLEVAGEKQKKGPLRENAANHKMMRRKPTAVALGIDQHRFGDECGSCAKIRRSVLYLYYMQQQVIETV